MKRPKGKMIKYCNGQRIDDFNARNWQARRQYTFFLSGCANAACKTDVWTSASGMAWEKRKNDLACKLLVHHCVHALCIDDEFGDSGAIWH